MDKLVSRIFKRVYQTISSYLIAITATVITINSETPLGVKVTAFDPHSLQERGCFLRLDKRKWLKEKPPKQVKEMMRMSKVSNRSSTSIFNRNRKEEPPALLNYLFNPILTEIGFRFLLENLSLEVK